MEKDWLDLAIEKNQNILGTIKGGNKWTQE